MLNVLEEANRCLQCKVPLCRKGCPINNPIPEFIKLLREGHIQEAGNLVFTNNPLSLVCSLVCPHPEYCEGHCILGRKQTPVRIGQIEHYIGQFVLDSLDLYSTEEYEGNIAVIGGGPAGIALAFFMQRVGYQVTIFDSQNRIGGIMRYGIPEFRLPNSILARLENKLRELGVIIHPNTLIGPVISVEDLLRDGYDAIFMSTGVWNPKKLNIPGETLGNSHYAIQYLKSPDYYTLGNRVAVIGAGNVAMDSARTAIRQITQDVTILYRKGEEDMPCRIDEYESAKMDGVNFLFYSQPTRITKEGVWYVKTDEEGNTEEYLHQCDSVIIAVSQESQKNIVASAPDIHLDERGRVIVNEEGMTTKAGVFASGDVTLGAQTINLAVTSAKKAANGMHNLIQRKNNPDWENELIYSYDIMETKEEDMERFKERSFEERQMAKYKMTFSK